MLDMYRQKFSGGMIVLGVVGLLVSLLGEVTRLGEYKSSLPRSWELFDQKLVIETPDIILLEKRLDSLINQSINHRTRKNVYHL